MGSDEAPFLDVNGLTLKTSSGIVYSDVSFQASKGNIVAVFASEGCGKTSLIMTLAARMRFSSGSATVGGFDLKKNHNKVRAITALSIIEKINDVPANSKVRDIVAAEFGMVGKHGGKDNVSAVLKEWDFEDKAKEKYSALSSYDKKLFGIMLACIADPELLLVDDVERGLSQHHSVRLVKTLRQVAQEKNILVLFNCISYDIACYADGIVTIDPLSEERRRESLSDNPDKYVPVLGTGSGVVTAEFSKAFPKEGDR